MNYEDFMTRMREESIRQSKKTLWMNRGILILNNIFALYQIAGIYYGFSNHPINYVLFGALCASIAWIWSLNWIIKLDIKNDKELIRRIEEMKEERNIEGMVKQIEESKKYYEDYARYHNIADKIYK